MLSLSKLVVGFSVIACGMVLAGCGGPKPPSEPGSPISGTITVGGKPPGTYCSVQFVSVANASETGSGGVDPTGRYGARVPLGKCKVALVMGAASTSSNPAAQYQAKGGAFPKAGQGDNKSSGPPKMAGAVDVPKQFQNPETSGIEVEVVAGKPLDIDFK